jgi:AcrR family transcriptional regulator
MTASAAATRGERRKRETETRLLDAALAVFTARGYDAATTGEIARAADVGAGTFYLHFRDKRAVYEGIARRASHDVLARWQAALRPGMALDERVVLGLRLVFEFWHGDPARARLLLEGGPAFGSEGHVRLVDEIARVLARDEPRRTTSRRSLALVVVGLGIELGRLIVADPTDTADVDAVIRLVRQAVTDDPSGGHRPTRVRQLARVRRPA